jgi:hypothetical protein
MSIVDKENLMNMLLPDKFDRVLGAKVKVVVYDINPLREDYSVSPILLSGLRDLARGTDILIEYSNDVLNEVTLTEKRIEDALAVTDADLLIFGSYVATQTNVQPMIHIVCTYGRAMEQSNVLPDGMNLDQAILEGDAILQMPRHVLLRDVMPVMAFETLSFQNSLADDIFHIAQFVQAVKLYKTDKFKEASQVIDAIVTQMGPSEQWPTYWVPFSYLYMLGGLAYLRMGEVQSAVYTMSNAITRSSPAKMRVQRCAELIISSLVEKQENSNEAPAAPEDTGSESSASMPKVE